MEFAYLGRKDISMEQDKYAIGIDLGGTYIKYALVSQKGKVLFSRKRASGADVSATVVIGELVKAIHEVQEFATAQQYTVAGVGIGTPGIIDETNRIVLGGAENIKGWENLNLADILEEKIGGPVLLSNDANAMGLGETLYGAGKGFTNVVFLTVGTGIGGAVIIDGKLFNGYANRGTELGHVPLIANGEPCACGSVGCLEQYASTSALVKHFIQRSNDSKIEHEQEVDGKYIVRLYKEGNALAIDCLEKHFDYLGRGIAGFINIFSPQLIVIGGGLSEAGEFYIEGIGEKARRYAIPSCAENTRIVSAGLGNEAGSIGAASLIFNNLG